MAFTPSINWPRTTIPPPTPEPRIAPKTTCAPAPAPSTASDSAKQLASLATLTGRSSAMARSSASVRPQSQVELPPCTTPVSRSTAPGTPMPTRVIGAPARPSRSSINPWIARRQPS